MKRLLLALLFSIPRILAAQTDKDSLIIFSGYIFDMDSIPVENAYLINYRTLRITATDSTGYFCTVLNRGDSLMISHISLERKMVFANDLPGVKNKYYLEMNCHQISAISVNDFAIELARFEKNMKVIYAQMQAQGIPIGLKKDSNAPANAYAPGAQNIGFGLNLFDLIRLLRKKK